MVFYFPSVCFGAQHRGKVIKVKKNKKKNHQRVPINEAQLPTKRNSGAQSGFSGKSAFTYFIFRTSKNVRQISSDFFYNTSSCIECGNVTKLTFDLQPYSYVAKCSTKLVNKLNLSGRKVFLIISNANVTFKTPILVKLRSVLSSVCG